MILLIGIIIGSFLNVCIYRIPQNQSIVLPSSHCFHCHTPLKTLDLIPVFSYMFLRGRCRYCNTKFSIRYLMVEILTGIIFLILFFKYGLNSNYIFYITLACILICITFIDYDHQIIPDGLIVSGFILGLLYKLTLYLFLKESIGIINSLLGFFIGGGLFLLIAVLSKGGMGGGDIKLMAMLGFLLEWRYIVFISLLSFIIGSIISIGLLLTKVKTRKDNIPFGPFIALATFISILYYEPIVSWYIKFIYKL